MSEIGRREPRSLEEHSERHSSASGFPACGPDHSRPRGQREHRSCLLRTARRDALKRCRKDFAGVARLLVLTGAVIMPAVPAVVQAGDSA